jgi:ABC-type bacteriocin/lantibiotic exporter with double-glycine peptidase domain
LEANFNDINWIGFLKSIPKKKLFSTVFYGVTRILISAAWPYLMYRYIQKQHSNTTEEIVIVTSGVSLAFILAGVASHRQSLINIAIMNDFSLKLVERMWAKMNRLEWLTFHGKNRVYFFDILMADAWRLRQGMMAWLEFIIINSIITIALTFFIAFVNRPLFILFVFCLLFTGAAHLYATTKTRPFVKRFQNAWRVQHHWIAKTADQFDLLKMGRGYAASEETNSKNTSAFLASNAAMLRAQSKYRTINQAAGNVARVVIFITGFYWVQVHYIQLTDLVLVLLIVSIVQNNLLQIPGAMHNFIEGQESGESITAFFSLPVEDQATNTPIANITRVDSVSIEGLTFNYDGKPLIEHRDIFLEKGKIYLWKGSNGSGKSTTAHILLGLLTPQGGTLIINGKQAPWATLRQLRNRFAFVNQDAPLFMGTVKENVLFGHPEAESAWGDLPSTWLSALMPDANTEDRLLGEKGEGLSGGEARRLALIREWIRSADMFILDEPLNHLDDYAINEIMREIVNIKANCIVIIISHQQGFEAIADEIRQF